MNTLTRITPSEARRMGLEIESEFNALVNNTTWTISVKRSGYELAYSSRTRKQALANLQKKIELGLIVLDECWICEKSFFKNGSICCEKCNENLPPC